MQSPFSDDELSSFIGEAMGPTQPADKSLVANLCRIIERQSQEIANLVQGHAPNSHGNHVSELKGLKSPILARKPCTLSVEGLHGKVCAPWNDSIPIRTEVSFVHAISKGK